MNLLKYVLSKLTVSKFLWTAISLLISVCWGLKNRNEQLKKENETLEKAERGIDEIINSDDVDVCVKLGGLRKECEGLRHNS